jgi:pre-60S factor REI1
MKSEWHVANVKRRAASLPSISQEQHEEGKGASPTSRPSMTSSKHFESDNEDRHDDGLVDSESSDASEEETHLNPARCLFCLHESSAIGANILHMKTIHGFHITDAEKLQEGLEALLWYLDLVINRFYSCLYCGHAKHSAEAARAHMLDKGHCMLDMSPDSEYLEFWSETAAAVDAQASNDEKEGKHEAHPRLLSPDELALGSGRIVVSRKNHSQSQKRNRIPRRDETSLVKVERPEETVPDPTEQNVSNGLQTLSNRDRMGLIGLSNAEQRLILATEKRMRSQASKKWSARHWTTENLSTSIKRTVFKQNLAGG